MPSKIEQDVLLRFKGDTRSLKSALGNVDKSLKKSAQHSANLAKETRGATQQFEVFGQLGGALPGQLGPAAGAVSALTGAFKNARGSLLAFGLVAGGVVLGIVKFSDEIGGLIKKVFTVSNEFGIFREGLKEVRKEMALAVDQSNKLNASLFPEEARVQLLQQQQELTETARIARIKLLETQRFLRVAVLDPNVEGFEAARDAIEQQFKAQRNAINRSAERTRSALLGRGNAQSGGTAGASAGGGGGSGGGLGSVAGQRVSPSGTTVNIPGGSGFSSSLGGRQSGSGLGGALGIGGQFGAGALGVDIPGLPGGAGGRVLTDDEIQRAEDQQARIQQAMEAFAVVSAAAQSSFDAWVSGSASASKALGGFFKGAVQGIASHMFAKSLEHGAFALGSLASGNPAGAAAHGKAAAAFAGGAVVVGALARQFGGSGGSGGARGGGGLSGAAAGAFGGGGGASSEVIILTGSPDDDQPREARRRRERQMARARDSRGAGTVVVRS